MNKYKVIMKNYIKIRKSIFGTNICDVEPIVKSKLKIYISGAITRDQEAGRDWKSKFLAYEIFLKRFFPNAIFVNPARMTPGKKLKPEHWVRDLKLWQYREVMKRDIKVLMNCDMIAFLPDWKDSTGALTEGAVATCLDLDQVYLPKIPTLNYLSRKK